MDLQFIVICLCLIVLSLVDYRSIKRGRLSPRKWLYLRLKQAGHEGTLGPPRLKMIRGDWYVLGCGRRFLVSTKAEGYRLMARMRREMNKTLETLPAEERKKHLVLL